MAADEPSGGGAPELGAETKTPTQMVDPLVGRQLGEYRVVERIGTGAMGIVYQAVQPLIGKQVAIKVLRPEIAAERAHVQRLLMEAQAVNAIRHRAIVDIIGFGQLDDGRHYIVMEHLVGCALDALLAERGPMSPAEAIPILDEVAAALSAAHAKGFVHRDLKPSNVFLVSQADGTRFVKLLDFGLVKQLQATGPDQNASIVGTPAYMAPEQAQGQELSFRADLYALGVLAFELLTGELPFKSNSIYELIKMHVEVPPPPPSTVSAGIPAAMDELVLWLLKKNPADRPPSAKTVSAELKQLSRALRDSSTQNAPHPLAPFEPVRPVVPPPAPSTLRNAPGRVRWPLAAALIVAGVGSALGGGWLLLREPSFSATAITAEPLPMKPPVIEPVATKVPLPGIPPVAPEPAPIPEPGVTERPGPGRVRNPKRKPVVAAAPAAAPVPGSLEVTPAFGWAEVHVDGKWRCTTPPVCTVTGLAPGPHRLELVGNPKVAPVSKKVVVSSGQTLKQRVALTPIGP